MSSGRTSAHSNHGLYTSRSREKMNMELGEHVKKAVSPVETAPKQKHVRAIIVYSYDFKTSLPFWHALKLQPVLTDEVQCFKALITIHKLLVGGPSQVLKEAVNEQAFLDICVRNLGQTNLGHGYGPLIRNYVSYLKTKLAFHQRHQDFNGSFNYEEYISLRGVGNPDEGYQTISDLLELASKLDRFVRALMTLLGPASAPNECRVSSLVPFIEESFGIYNFLTSMLTALHLTIASAEPLLPLVEAYNTFFRRLAQFYSDCRKIIYLTSLITIPDLPSPCPTFDAEGRHQMAQQQNQSSSHWYGSLEVEQLDDESMIHNLVAPNINREVVEEANEQLMKLGLQLQEAIDKNIESEAIILDLSQAKDKIKQLEDIIDGLQNNAAAEAKAAEYKSKYDGIVKLYQQLRSEHLELLQSLDGGRNNDDEDFRNMALQKELAEDRARELEEQLRVIEEQLSISSLESSSLDDELANISNTIADLIDKLAAIECSDSSLFKMKGLSGRLAELIALLIKRATDLQREIEEEGGKSKDPKSFYLKNSVWTKGLISAAQAVGSSAVAFSETADKVLTGQMDADYLSVSAGALSASVAQLVAASRVKARRGSEKLALLEETALMVKNQNVEIGQSVKDHHQSHPSQSEDNDQPSRVLEMELKVGIIKREREIEEMRAKIGALHRAKYA